MCSLVPYQHMCMCIHKLMTVVERELTYMCFKKMGSVVFSADTSPRLSHPLQHLVPCPSLVVTLLLPLPPCPPTLPPTTRALALLSSMPPQSYFLSPCLSLQVSTPLCPLSKQEATVRCLKSWREICVK